MLDYQAFLDFMKEYSSHYLKMLTFETKKLNYIAKDDINNLRELLNEEQAIIMTTNQLEKTRLKFLSSENADITLKQLEESAPDNLKNDYHKVCGDMTKYLLQIKKVNKQTEEIVSKRLKTIDSIQKETSSTYTKSGSKNHFGMSSTIDKDV